jgi:hypothetical protein
MPVFDSQQQVLAIAEGLGVPDHASWLWLQPGQLKLICEAIARQAARAPESEGEEHAD